MPAISLDNEIKKYLPLLGSNEKKSLLSVIKSFLIIKEEAKVPQRLSIEEYNTELKAAEARIDSGHFFTQEQVEKMAKNW
jgi:hypothetical protein